jgi:hypothetical protein
MKPTIWNGLDVANHRLRQTLSTDILGPLGAGIAQHLAPRPPARTNGGPNASGVDGSASADVYTRSGVSNL